MVDIGYALEMFYANYIKNVVEKNINNPYNKPTDIIGFSEVGRNLANLLSETINEKEICFFDEKIKSDEIFHYLDFKDMLLKTEIMIFTVELPKEYYKYLSGLNKEVKIFIPHSFEQTITALKENGCENNLVFLSAK